MSDTERAVLACALRSPRMFTAARRIVTAADFTPDSPGQALWSACCDLADAGTDVDPIVVYDELVRRGERRIEATALADLYALPVVEGNAEHYARQLRSRSRRRQLAVIGTRLAQLAEDVPDMDDMLTTAARESLALQLLIDDDETDGPVPGLSTWGEFLSQQDRSEDWIVPGLLERMNTVMFIARGGSGKSWLSRQVCMCVEAGVHPLRPNVRIPPARTFLIDLENTPDLVRRQSRGLRDHVARLGQRSPDGAYIWAWPEGLDIRKRADAQLLERAVSQVQPALVCIGSLWNLARRGSSDWDTLAEETIVVLNRIRRRYRCAIWIEHHMPKGESKTPFGSSAWERFIEFGRVLDHVGPNLWGLRNFRDADRDVREWPAGLSRGGALPWSPIYDEEEFSILVEAGEGRLS